MVGPAHMVIPLHSEGVGGGPGAGGEGDAVGAGTLTPARLQPRLGVMNPSLWQRGQCASCSVLSDQLHGSTVTRTATSDYNSCNNK